MAFQGFLKQSTAVDVLIGPFLDETDGKTAEAALTISQADVKLSKNGQTLAQKNDVTAAAADADGYYNCELDATDTNTVGQLTIIIHESGALPVRLDYHVVEEAVYDAMYGGSAAGPLQSTAAGRTLDVAATGEAGVDLGNVTGTLTQANVGWVDSSSRVDVGKWLGTAVTLSATTTKPEVDVASISDDATAANNAELAFDGTGYAFTGCTMPWNAAWDAEVQSEVNDGLVAFFTSSAQLVDDIWDEVITKAAHNVANSAAKYMRQVKQSVSVSESAINDPGAAATTTVFNTDLTEVDDFWNDCVLVFTSGSLAGQAKPIADFANANGTITLDEALTSAPADNDEFVILSTHVHPVSQISNGVLTTAMTEAYAADGATFTVAQALYEICQSVSEFAIADMTKTVKKRDGSTTAATYTLDDATSPTSITRAT